METARKLDYSWELEKIGVKYPDLVKDIITISKTLSHEWVHEASNFPIHEILQDLNMLEQELEINRMNELTLSRVAANDAMAKSFMETDNRWVLWYDTSPEVTALWKQMEAEAHQRFRQQYLGK